MPLILSGNVATATADVGYNVANSCRFNDDDSQKMTRTNPSEDSTDQDEGTYSWWMKPTTATSTQYIVAVESGDERFLWYYNQNTFAGGYRDSDGSPNIDFAISPAAKFRDPASWYHCVLTWDTDQGTAANRLRFYVNNVEYTVTQSEELPSGQVMPQNKNAFNGTTLFAATDNSSEYDGYIAEFVFIDGQQLTPSSFAEADEDSPTIWKPIDVSGLTFGNLGYYLDFEDSDNLGDDESGNGDDFSETNLAATDQATDTPTNNFCVMNPLSIDPDSTFTFSEGNLQYATSSSTRGYWVSTIGVSTGKWYFEYKVTNNQSRTDVGIAGAPAKSNNDPESTDTHDNVTVYRTIGGDIHYNSGNGDDNYYNTATGDDDIIIGCALDLTSGTNTIAFSIDGAWVTGDGTTSTDFANVLLNDDFTNVASTVNGVYHFIAGDDGGDQDIGGQVNFGNPVHSISSGNADANGYGNFEYAVPSGYLSLCTKNLGSDGG